MSEDQKLAFLAAAFSPGAKVAELARAGGYLHEPDLSLAQGLHGGDTDWVHAGDVVG